MFIQPELPQKKAATTPGGLWERRKRNPIESNEFLSCFHEGFDGRKNNSI
jgi:hypothetical protein